MIVKMNFYDGSPTQTYICKTKAEGLRQLDSLRSVYKLISVSISDDYISAIAKENKLKYVYRID